MNDTNETTRIINKMIDENSRLREIFASVTGKQAGYRYYENDKGDRYFYTKLN